MLRQVRHLNRSMQFLPRRFSLSGLLALEEAVARMMDEGHLVNVTFLDLTKALTPQTKKFFWQGSSPLVLAMPSLNGLKHPLLDGSRVYALVSAKLGVRPGFISLICQEPLRFSWCTDAPLCGSCQNCASPCTMKQPSRVSYHLVGPVREVKPANQPC